MRGLTGRSRLVRRNDARQSDDQHQDDRGHAREAGEGGSARGCDPLRAGFDSRGYGRKELASGPIPVDVGAIAAALELVVELLVVHESSSCAESVAGAAEPPLDGPGRDAQPRPDLAHAIAVQVVEHEHGALVDRQSGEGIVKVGRVGGRTGSEIPIGLLDCFIDRDFTNAPHDDAGPSGIR